MCAVRADASEPPAPVRGQIHPLTSQCIKTKQADLTPCSPCCVLKAFDKSETRRFSKGNAGEKNHFLSFPHFVRVILHSRQITAEVAQFGITDISDCQKLMLNSYIMTGRLFCMTRKSGDSLHSH